MKAAVYRDYGPPEVLHLDEVEQPAPKDNEILLRNRATSVNYGDLLARDFKHVPLSRFHMPGLFWLLARAQFGFGTPSNPILGSEFAGEVEAVGSAVQRFKAGDEVFGYLGQGMRGYAEYVCAPEDGEVALKPSNLSFLEAAVVPYGASTAFKLLKKVNVQSGQRVLINGASGNIGSFALQLAKAAGAQVTGVCSTPRVEFVQSLGADAVVDYTQEDFTERGETYDLVFDVLGRSSFARCKRVLESNGRYLRASFKTPHLLQMLWTAMAGNKKIICALAPEKPAVLGEIKSLIEAGKIKAVVDKSFPLDQAAEAHRYVESGHKQGFVALSLDDGGA